MSKGMAVAIFKDIYTQVATEEEKMESIKMVLSMATHNGITKQDFKNVLRYLMGRMEKQENKWIPVEERLPNNNENVLVTTDMGLIASGYVAHGEWITDQEPDYPIAWRPLPDPYNPKEDN